MLPFDVVSNSDLLVVIGSNAMIILALVSSGKYAVNRSHGIVFVSVYLGYLAYVVQREWPPVAERVAWSRLDAASDLIVFSRSAE